VSDLFTCLTHAVEGPVVVALLASFLWGILSILLSPCHLACIPMIIGLVDKQGRGAMRHTITTALLFATGILLSIALIGWITTLAGQIMGDMGKYGNWLAAAVFFIMGLQLLGVFPSLWKRPGQKKTETVAPWNALITGLVFGIALGPCTFAFMAPVLAAAFNLSAEAPALAWSLVLSYGFGHCTLIVLAGVSAKSIQRYLNWNERSTGAIRLRRLCGILILLAGLYLVYTAH
jgi:cytochrome c-type biogenesis protein